MATAAVIGLSGGKRLLSSSYHYFDIIEKLSYGTDFGSTHYQIGFKYYDFFIVTMNIFHFMLSIGNCSLCYPVLGRISEESLEWK